MKKNTHKISKITALHYLKLFFRSAIFVAALVLYIINKVQKSDKIFGNIGSNTAVLITIWVIYAIEAALRFFPTKLESMGCQKQFKRNYYPQSFEENIKPDRMKGSKTFIVAVLWIIPNLLLGILHHCGLYDEGILILLFLLYSVGDMICVLFFCPFHTWIMKNKCCTTCRIYNWDYAMMFTPLIFIPGIFSWSLVAISLILLIEWEMLYKIYPERFTENTNRNLRCQNCEEKVCQHKKQLQHYLKEYKKLEKKKKAQTAHANVSPKEPAQIK